MLAVCGRFASFLFAALFSNSGPPTCLQSWLHFRTPGRAPKKGPCPSFQDSVPIGEEFGAQIWGVVNNSCGFNPQRKVVALIFSAARLPRLLEEICWQFAAGLPAFSSLPFFELRPQLVCKVGSIFGPQAGPRKRVPVLLFKTVSQLGKSLGPKFGVQIWDPILGPKFGPT